MASSESPPPQPRRYAMFISYRHADNLEMGRKWATWLHESVENYEIPEDLAGKTNLRGEMVPATLYPVFRDEEELPADADLSVNIRRALENSNLLVVLCSPRAVQSRFVADEIRHFKEIGKSNRILALMIDGEPNASDDPEKRARLGAAAECFPEPLKFGVPDETGKIDWSARTEPIAADCRPGGQPEQGWTTAAAYEVALEKIPGLSRPRRASAVHEYAERLELAKLKIIAGALGLPLGELTQRDKARQLRKAKKRARLLVLLSGVFAVLAGIAVMLGIMANQRRAEAETQRREAERQRQEATTQRQQADIQRASAVEARGMAETEKQQAVRTLAGSDFQEGANRLENPATARGGMAYLARSARAGNQAATTRIWTLFQQHPFWLPAETPEVAPAPFRTHVQEQIPPDNFTTVVLNGENTEPTWYAESADRRRCVTVVSNAIAGEGGSITFRGWATSGRAIGGWHEIDYQGENYLAGIESAVLSDDGKFVAVIATPWRAPQFIEVWDVDRGVRIGDPIPAGGGHPNYQSGAFTDAWFTSPDDDSPGIYLVTQSNRGDASIHLVLADDDSSNLHTVTTNSHDQPVQITVVDLKHRLFASAAADRSIRVSTLETAGSIGWPILADGAVEGLQIQSPVQFSIRLEREKAAAWKLVLPTKLPQPAQKTLQSTDPRGLHKIWPDDGDEEAEVPETIVADQRGNRRLQIANELEVQVLEGERTVWRRRFPSAVVHARFSGDDRVVVQTGFFVTEVWDVKSDALSQPAIDETGLFTADTSSDTVLLSSISPDGKFVLTRSFLWNPPNIGIYSFTVWDGATGKPLSDRQRFVENVALDALPENHAEFSADGNHLLFGRSGENAKPDVTSSLQLHPPPAAASLTADLAEALSGYRLDDENRLVKLMMNPFPVLEKARTAAAGESP